MIFVTNFLTVFTVSVLSLCKNKEVHLDDNIRLHFISLTNTLEMIKWQKNLNWWLPGLHVININYSCSSQLSMKFQFVTKSKIIKSKVFPHFKKLR